ncbi:uncharacterized protein EDB91DRAFT_1247178 [Suillus paluster]|uniref:uncharacterized protein n=1 Tax=Suillus paluster TaxID=48578 RepID=UPI001B87619A|nr:uncharacterized protein EDB91DRAFT_1247178 [Suillus paluster]KAG1743691.1 hypothetical protein EDB91DRAFT_1247178 [Suillus paluster]
MLKDDFTKASVIRECRAALESGCIRPQLLLPSLPFLSIERRWLRAGTTPGGYLYLLLHADTLGSGQSSPDNEDPCAGQGKAPATVDSELDLVRELVPPKVKLFLEKEPHKQDHEQPYNSRFAMRETPDTA